MTELLRCIPAEVKEEMDYPDLSGKKRKGRLPLAKSTKSTRSIERVVSCQAVKRWRGK